MKKVNLWRIFGKDEQGQSLTEHTLLLAFLSLVALSVFLAAGGNTQNIWVMGNNQLAAANTSAGVTPSTASGQVHHEGNGTH